MWRENKGKSVQFKGMRDGGTIYSPSPVSRDGGGNADISIINQHSSTNPLFLFFLSSQRDTLC